MENSQNFKKSTVGQYIRARREALGLSQKALGSLMTPSVSTQFISNIERGITSLPTHHVEKIAVALGVAKEEVLIALELDYSSKISKKVHTEHDQSWFKNCSEFFSKLTSHELHMFKQILANYPESTNETRERFLSLAYQIFPLTSAVRQSSPQVLPQLVPQLMPQLMIDTQLRAVDLTKPEEQTDMTISGTLVNALAS